MCVTLDTMSAGREAPRLTPLGKHMDRRAGELGLTWIDIARISGVDRETLRKMRYGLMGKRGAAPRTKHAVEDALHWAAGSIDAADDGRDPIPKAPPGTANTPTAHHSGDAPAVGDEVNDVPVGGRTVTFDEVLEHLHAAHALGYGWQALDRMNRLHNPLAVEPTQPHDTDRSA